MPRIDITITKTWSFSYELDDDALAALGKTLQTGDRPTLSSVGAAIAAVANDRECVYADVSLLRLYKLRDWVAAHSRVSLIK